MEPALSTRRDRGRLGCPVVVAHGTRETPEFQRQARDFAAAAKAAGKPAQLLVAQGYNHFEIYETLANPYGLLGRAVLEQMKLVPALSAPPHRVGALAAGAHRASCSSVFRLS